MSLKFITEGHYKDESAEYMSIWTFKKKKGIKPNSNAINYEDAISISCSDRKWLPFNASNQFKNGWHYNVICLEDFYTK
jgi:hypothetical protein